MLLVPVGLAVTTVLPPTVKLLPLPASVTLLIVTEPGVVTLPAVTLPVADIVEVEVIACASLITVAPLILIAIFALLKFELGLFLQLSFDLSNILS